MKKMMLIFLILITMIVGCSKEQKNDEFSTEPHIQGNVISVNAQQGSIYVEGELEEGNQYDKAHIKVNENTAIYIYEGEHGEVAVFSMIEEGDLVKVWFVGPVAESYPVQATAGKIFIYKQ